MNIKHFDLKKMILGNARINNGSQLWEPHFLAVRVDAFMKADEADVEIEISAKLWEKAVAELNAAECVALLTLIVGDEVVGYHMPSRAEHAEDCARRFGNGVW